MFLKFNVLKNTKPTINPYKHAIAAVVAGAEPEIDPKNADAAVETLASPPVNRPTKRDAKPTNLYDILASAIIFPANKNNGIAMIGKELIPLNIFCATIIKGTSPSIKDATEAKPSAKVIGIPFHNS